MTTAFLRLAIAVLSLTGWVGAASSQASRSADEVLLAAAQHLMNNVPGHRVAIDPREVNPSTVAGNGSYVGVRAADRTRALAERVGARVQTAHSAIRCITSERRQCTPGELERVIGLSEPAITGDTAVVHASVSWITGSATNPAVTTRNVVLTLTRTGSAWRVIEQRITRIT